MPKTEDARPLSTKQKRFIELYNGNGTEAAKAAGYSARSAHVFAARLLDDPRIVAGIQAREKERNAPDIAKAEERKIFWSAIMRDEGQDIKARLRASELLGRSEGDFIDRKEITGADGAPLSVRSILCELEEYERKAAERGRMIERGTGDNAGQ